jgi:hypothetical protein
MIFKKSSLKLTEEPVPVKVVPPASPNPVFAASPPPLGHTPQDPFMPWMAWMLDHLHEIQKTGFAPTAFTQEIFKYTSFGPLGGVTPMSCAATVCAALEETGYQSTRDASAISYKSYGSPCSLTVGCVVVFLWASGQHHVDFCHRIIDGDLMEGLGGNQGSELNECTFHRKYIIATRWPIKK